MSEPEKVFRDPSLALNRIYTRRGDAGETRLVGGQRIGKDALRIDTYGTIDELNAFAGMACFTCEELLASHPALAPLAAILRRVQHELFNAGSILATMPEDAGPRQPRITPREVEQLEEEIDRMNAGLAPLASFVLAGGSRLNTELHACRTICRRGERLAVGLSRIEPVPADVLRYLNRLSDAFFVWSRWANAVMDVAEVLWQPNQAASARTTSPAPPAPASESPDKSSEPAR